MNKQLYICESAKECIKTLKYKCGHSVPHLFVKDMCFNSCGKGIDFKDKCIQYTIEWDSDNNE